MDSRSVIIKGWGWKQWIDEITYRLNSFAYVIWTIALGESPISDRNTYNDVIELDWDIKLEYVITLSYSFPTVLTV